MKVWDPAKPITVETTPLGKRISDGIIWAYEASGFYRVSPSDDVVWSRSMIEESGGCLVDDGELDPEPSPSRLIPWLSRQSISHDVNGTITTSVCDKMSLDDTGASHALPSAESQKEDQRVEGGHILQDVITTCHLPEFLLINDPHNHTGSVVRTIASDSCMKSTARYVRAIPPISHKELVPLAEIHLLCASPIARIDFTAHLGDGNHSSVYRAMLQLLWVDYGVSIAVKIASSDIGASSMLSHEARMYSSFPEHLMDDWTGFHYLEEAEHNGDGIVRVNAVVPKFYGCYVPVVKNKHERSTRKLRPILLIEDCGQPVVPPSLTFEQRKECSSLVARFHRAGYVHNSLYSRNILMQPGPLTSPPSLRSMDSPSFRLIDFGRTELLDGYRSRKTSLGINEEEIDKQWQRNMGNELRVAKELFIAV